jgi:hypothetical protein
MLCKLYSNENILSCACTLGGASSFHFKAPFCGYHSIWFHLVSCLNNIEGVMIPCLFTLYFNSNGICCAQTLRSFFILFRALFWSSHNIFIWFAIWIFWLLSSFVGSLTLILFVIFDPQYRLISSELWFLGLHILWRDSHYIGLLSISTHFGNGWQWGRSFEGLKGIGPDALVLFLSICLACFAWLSI